MLPELSETKLIEWKMHVVNSKTMNYDIILGRDILEQQILRKNKLLGKKHLFP